MDRRDWLGAVAAVMCLGSLTATSSAAGPEYKELAGKWQVIELVDNGRVVPRESIPYWLPSGGQLEIVDNAIVFTSPKDGERHARTFSLDATVYPRAMNAINEGQVTGQGIYELKDGRLVVCLVAVQDGARPQEFSARAGSNRVLMVLERPEAAATTAARPATTAAATPPATPVTAPTSTQPLNTLPAPPTTPAAPATPVSKLTDAQMVAMLPGTWKVIDAYGAMFLTLDKNGLYSTFRESVQTSAFQKVFARVPVSSGTWTVDKARLAFRCTSSVQVERINKTFPFTLQSIGQTELTFVDYAGNKGRAERAQ
ncbi:MAG: TIGR03067 domain-containing protein [Pirellulales bacterium]